MALRFQQKLVVPTAAHPLVERAELLELLEQAVNAKSVVALAAPAGWGKTTVLAQWAAQSSLPIAWYTLDSTDRDPHLFLDYLPHAVAAYAPDAPELARQLAGTPPQALPELFRTAALAIAAAPEPFALVLDDYHTLEDDSIPVLPGTELIFDLLARLAAYAPHCHLVISSRMLPNLRGIARLIASRRAVVFDDAMLQWTADEVRLLAASGGGTISAEYAEQLVARMSGWVTGIALSLDQARTEGRGVRAESPGAGRSVLSLQSSDLILADTAQAYAYFAEQIIAPLAPALQRFLEETSVLDNLSPQHCNAFRRTHDAARMLDEVARRCLFVARRGGWLVYHSLFREFLRMRLAQDPARERR